MSEQVQASTGRLQRAARRIIFSLLVVSSSGAALVWWSYPDVRSLATAQPTSTAFIEFAVARGGNVRWTWVPDARIAPSLRKAVVTAEDLSFFSHNGFDRHEVQAAIEEALAGGRVRGASTITQQLAKNLWLSPSRNPIRKLRELLLTRSLEKHLSKRRILELYLNVAEFGPATFGAEAASQRYFGKSASDLTQEEAAQLAASLPASSWHPGVTSQRYQAHLGRLRTRMQQLDWLDQLVR